MLAPIMNGKFVAYGGSDFRVDTELKGEVVYVAGTELLIMPYQNYYHLLIEGNLRRPVSTENCGLETKPETQCGWVFYRDYIIAWKGPSAPPIIKMETYAVGGRPDPAGSDPGPPKVRDMVTGEVRPIQRGDHVRISGLYVIDYAHTIYWNTTSSSFSYTAGLRKHAFAHSEFHPYNYHSIELIGNLPPSAQLYDEFHTVCAPVYQEFYPSTWLGNLGVKQHLVDTSKIETRTARFYIKAPPKPAFDYKPRFVHTDVLKLGQGSVTVTPYQVTDDGVTVAVTVTGRDVLNPLIYRGKYAVEWVPPGAPTVDPRCAEIRAQLDKLNSQVLLLQAQKAGLDPMDPDDLMQLYWINNQIKPLQAEITNLKLQASALGCP